MKAGKLREILNVINGDFDIMIDGEDAEDRIGIDYKFGYVFLHSKTQDDDDEDEE